MSWLSRAGDRKRRSAEAAHGTNAPVAQRSVFQAPDLGNWYDPVILGPGTVGALAASSACLRAAMRIVEQLEPDDYVRYLSSYYRAGLERFGDAWRYGDIVTALLAAAQLVQPESYLEIGVRRGRSMAMIAASCPECAIVGCDLWMPDYAGMPNPGPDFVRAEIAKLGHRGSLQLLSGDSHELLPRYFAEHPDAFFDLITVDGDHSERGAEQDLRDVRTRVKVGGVIVFDDISHPDFPYMGDVWRRAIASDQSFATWEFTELGYGVAVAVRRRS